MFVLGGFLFISQDGLASMQFWNGSDSDVGDREMYFQCPRAYMGIREDLLPTHWQVGTDRMVLRLKASQVQRGDMLCIYQDGKGVSVGSVQRLVPAGYKCVSDGVGNFRCQKRR